MAGRMGSDIFTDTTGRLNSFGGIFLPCNLVHLTKALTLLKPSSSDYPTIISDPFVSVGNGEIHF